MHQDVTELILGQSRVYVYGVRVVSAEPDIVIEITTKAGSAVILWNEVRGRQDDSPFLTFVSERRPQKFAEARPCHLFLGYLGRSR